LNKGIKTYSNPSREERRLSVPCNLCGGAELIDLWKLDGFEFRRCAGCGLIQQNPQSAPQTVRERYDAEYLSYELQNEGGFLRLALQALADVGFSLDPAAHADTMHAEAAHAEGQAPRFLDIGCATGALLLELRARGWDTLGIEVCAPSADYAAKERKLSVLKLPLEECRLEAESLDAAYMGHVIEHLNDPSGSLREIWRVLRPGGELVVITPNAAGFQARAFGPAWRSAINDHLYLFSLRLLADMLRAAGFEVLAYKTWGGWAKGARPAFIKPVLDKLAKPLGFGDVMVMRARKPALGGKRA
jgi:SAM-dependent methyltransferase